LAALLRCSRVSYSWIEESLRGLNEGQRQNSLSLERLEKEQLKLGRQQTRNTILVEGIVANMPTAPNGQMSEDGEDNLILLRVPLARGNGGGGSLLRAGRAFLWRHRVGRFLGTGYARFWRHRSGGRLPALTALFPKILEDLRR
jgi:hypothetical protein